MADLRHDSIQLKEEFGSKVAASRRDSCGTAGKHRPQMADLFVNFFRGGYGVRDFLSEYLAMTRAQPLHGGLHGSLSHPKPCTDLRIRRRPAFARLEIFQEVEQVRFPDRHVFLA